ncbi:MAG: hypothetical protein KDA32_14625 [Phycisphaerales bacterium]|nr:hypothetical protein [Phycisphaerales bacterium]
MRSTRLIGALLVFAGVSGAVANAQIKWGTDAKAGIDQAKTQLKPLMFYVLGRTADRDRDIERDQIRAFQDPRVIEMAKKFITVRMSRSVHRDLLRDWGVPDRATMWVVFADGQGRLLGDPLGATGVAVADSLAQRMALSFQAFRRTLFDEVLREKLTNAETSEADIRTALGLVEEDTITVADEIIVELLKREKLEDATRAKAVSALAKLSSKPAVEELFRLALAKDAAATERLGKITPTGAEYLLPELEGGKAAERIVAYTAVVASCKIKSRKPEEFWTSQPAKTQEAEIERVSKAVKKAAENWRDHYEPYY